MDVETTLTILLVDDEEPVRRTFREWLQSERLDCTVLSAADSATALDLADKRGSTGIDLAILDWNLGVGNGLELLRDLQYFCPHIVAVMITGYANQATPLEAMRMGVRDYLDKNKDLNRQSFLEVVQRQLNFIRPARRERQLMTRLQSFRSAVEKVVPLVQAASVLQDPVPLPTAVRSLLRFVLRTTQATDGVLFVRTYDEQRQPVEFSRVYDLEGRVREGPLLPFANSLASVVTSLGEPAIISNLRSESQSLGMELQPFEREHYNLLAAPLEIGSNIQVVLELFDKEGGFSHEDRAVVRAATEFGTELIRQALAERQTQQLLMDALQAALKTSDAVTRGMQGIQPLPSVNDGDVTQDGGKENLGRGIRPEDPPPDAVLAEVRAGLQEHFGVSLGGIDAEHTIRLAEAVRVLARRYGVPALEHCIRLLESTRGLLDEVTGQGETS